LYWSLSFSALQRAENSSILIIAAPSFEIEVSVLFSEPKIPQSQRCDQYLQSVRVSVLFSEPKIPQCRLTNQRGKLCIRFQCSSASRKFLNREAHARRARSSHVSVLFSEPKIPQCGPALVVLASQAVSVLFSEPKIPQLSVRNWRVAIVPCFSALQRAENSSMRGVRVHDILVRSVSVLFSEPKIPQSGFETFRVRCRIRFSALQRAENSSIYIRNFHGFINL